jgi:hypothetical protein
MFGDGRKGFFAAFAGRDAGFDRFAAGFGGFALVFFAIDAQSIQGALPDKPGGGVRQYDSTRSAPAYFVVGARFGG